MIKLINLELYNDQTVYYSSSQELSLILDPKGLSQAPKDLNLLLRQAQMILKIKTPIISQKLQPLNRHKLSSIGFPQLIINYIKTYTAK